MRSPSATPGRRSTTGQRRRLRFAAVALGFAAALAFGESGIAAAASAPAPSQGLSGPAPTGRPTASKPLALVWSPLNHSAFPSVTELANRSLLLVFRQGSNHYAARDGFIRSRRSTDLGATWSAPVTVIPRALGTDYRDPSISTSTSGSTLYLTYFKGTAANGAAGSFFRSSANGGATWSREIRIDPTFPSSAITAPAVQLADGSLVTVHYSKSAGESRDSVWLSRSRDNGLTWTTTRLINGTSADRDYQEPYLVRQGADLFLTFRWGHNDSIGSMMSSDSGATWSTPAADFPGSGRPSSVWLADGTIVVYVRDSVGQFDIRVTHDRGATWGPARLVQSPPTGGASTYASFVEVSPGRVFTVMAAEDATATRSRVTFTYAVSGMLS